MLFEWRFGLKRLGSSLRGHVYVKVFYLRDLGVAVTRAWNSVASLATGGAA